ncbi:unnamed protein product [Thelazia callipaeda]|uniref:CDT1 domain-containing protein n=1 Tax=Thelazia callipaeda TaxID=103827 RepID=A0A0N5D8U5_THECL|nr:unnamed protein product [Thelazia callipaeda]
MKYEEENISNNFSKFNILSNYERPKMFAQTANVKKKDPQHKISEILAADSTSKDSRSESPITPSEKKLQVIPYENCQLSKKPKEVRNQTSDLQLKLKSVENSKVPMAQELSDRVLKTRESQPVKRIYPNYENLKSNKRWINSKQEIKEEASKSITTSRRFIKMKVILRQHLYNKVVENAIIAEVIDTSTLIEALKFLLCNTSIPALCSDYGRLFLLPDDNQNTKARELSYEENRFKMLTELCPTAMRCSFLLDLTNTFHASKFSHSSSSFPL